MTTPYLSTEKQKHTPYLTRNCAYCHQTVTSVGGEKGLHAAYLRHVRKHHREFIVEVRKPTITSKPITPKPAAPKPFVTCPYCQLEIASVRASALPGMLVRHKRNEHEDAFIEEIATRRRESLKASEVVDFVEAEVIPPVYYVKASLASKVPVPKKVKVPAVWGVGRVHVRVCQDGVARAYRHGLVGEAVEVG